MPWFVLVVAFALQGCEKPSHENIERWYKTEKGPKKLEKALKNPDLDPDLRGHAAEQLILLDKAKEVLRVIEGMGTTERSSVVEDLVARLWEVARISGEFVVPSSAQLTAKDTLFALRPMANESTRGKIDEYLVEWLAGGYYEKRAESGNISGAAIIRAVGREAGPRLVTSANSILVRPKGKDGRVVALGSNLLLGLAVTGHPDAVGFLIKLVGRADKLKRKRLKEAAMGALYTAYVEPKGFDPADSRGLKPHVSQLLAMSTDQSLSGRVRNDSIAVLEKVGMPECLEAFVGLINDVGKRAGAPQQLLYAGLQRGIRCSGAAGVEPLANALSATGSYERGFLDNYFWQETETLGEEKSVGDAALRLLGSKSWVARVSGIELLALARSKGTEGAHVKALQRLARDSAILPGWWKDREDLPDAMRKKAPTIGRVAEEAVKRRRGLARSTETTQ